MQPTHIPLVAAMGALLLAACTPLAKRAAAGDADARLRYGRMLLKKDRHTHAKDAFAWFRAAADQGQPTATAAVALCYEKGLGVAQDLRLARLWYGKAESLGHVESTLALAAMDLREGDAAQATRRLDPLCERHFLPAELCLALLYLRPDSPHYNPAKGIRYLRYAALDGSAEAAAMMADCYANGLGVPRNATLAKGWSALAQNPRALRL